MKRKYAEYPSYVEAAANRQTKYNETVKAVTNQKVQSFIKQLISAGNHASIVMMPEK